MPLAAQWELEVSHQPAELSELAVPRELAVSRPRVEPWELAVSAQPAAQ
jgi:hypothetical protein